MMISVATLLLACASVAVVRGQDEDAAEVFGARAFKLCKAALKDEPTDGTNWHWTKYLCSEVQEATEDYFADMVRAEFSRSLRLD